MLLKFKILDYLPSCLVIRQHSENAVFQNLGRVFLPSLAQGSRLDAAVIAGVPVVYFILQFFAGEFNFL